MDSLETQTQLAVLRTYVENQTILELILLYWASKCKNANKTRSNCAIKVAISQRNTN